MFKTEVEPRAAGAWFHYQVLNRFYSIISMVYESADHEKILSTRFLQ